MKQFINPRNLLIAGIIILAAVIRFIPHPPNVSPILAMALLGGAFLNNRKLALLIPILAMFLSDIFLGFHEAMPGVYLSFALVVGIGTYLDKQKNAGRVVIASIVSSVVFFILSNISIWLFASWYPFTLTGLIECYTMALPFFRNTLLSSAAYSLVFFGIIALAGKYVPLFRLQTEKA